MPSKYQAEWKAFSKNEAYWDEVLVGRMIFSSAYDAITPARVTSADGPGPVARYSITLDTKVVVYLPGDPDWDDLELIARAPARARRVMQRIQRIVWDDVGIAELVLEFGTIKLDKTWNGRGRLWIQDGWARAGTTSDPTPGVDPIAEEVDKQILERRSMKGRP